MTNANQGTAKYLETQIATAPREQLVVLLYNGALRFLSEAKAAMQKGDIPRQADRIHRAQNVLVELMSSLNMEQGKEIAANLFRLYTFFFDQLTEASVNDNLQALETVEEQMRVLRDAFQEAERLARAQPAQHHSGRSSE
jgi:flagellar protein FliS